MEPFLQTSERPRYHASGNYVNVSKYVGTWSITVSVLLTYQKQHRSSIDIPYKWSVKTIKANHKFSFTICNACLDENNKYGRLTWRWHSN